MSRSRFGYLLLSLPIAPLAMFLTGCGSSSPTVSVPPPAAYSLAATALSPVSVAAGGTTTSTITVTPAYGYQGNVTLSCTSVTGGGTPAPTCSFSQNPVAITSTAAGSSTLTVSTTTGTPSGGYTIKVTGQDTNSMPPGNGAQTLAVTVKFQHIVIIFQENRSPDNLFHDSKLMARGADIALMGNNFGNQITLAQTELGIDYDLSHAHSAFLDMYDGGKMDGAANIPISCAKGVTGCPPPNPQFLYVNPSEVAPYFQMAEQYTFGDRMFQTNQGPSFPAHQFIISGTSEPSSGSTSFIAENAVGIANAGQNTGCTSPPNEYVYVIDPSGNEPSTMYPCADHPTLTDELNAKGIDWRYYTPSAGLLWTGPNAIEHMCGPNLPPPNATQCVGSDWVNHVVLYTTAAPAPILTDITNNQLPPVSWVIPAGQNSDHAGSTATTGGPSWVAAIVNAIGASPYWSNTAIIITWDDWGGWYDHVPPSKVVNDGVSWGSGYVYGFRVPLIVVSAYAKPQYISHANHDFGSILNLIEETFDLPSLGYADAYADDLSDCFDFNQTPNVFQTINAPLKADHFLNDKSPPTDPDND